MDLKGQHILSTSQFDKKSLLELFKDAGDMEKVIQEGGSDILKDKILGTLFFEPSTRTRFSFEAAMLRLGGNVISGADMLETSSLQKGESLEDTGKVVSQIVDVIAMRHPEPGSVSALALRCDVPVINAGDGPSEHPTQGILDLYTIWKEHGGLDGLTIGMTGDLKYSRVCHSQCDLLKHFDVKFIFVSPGQLKMPREIVNELAGSELEVKEVADFEDVIGDMDVIGCTRIQKERFSSDYEYKKHSGVYVLTPEMMKKAKKDAIVIHPLPRVDEISVSVDDDARARYFEQVGNGVEIRMALLKKVLLG